MSTTKTIIRSTGIICGFTFLSRILGFVRDILIARLFGTGSSIQAFVVAFRIPNVLRELIGEGSTNAVFVPVFSEYLIKNKGELFKIVNILFNILFIIFCMITFLGIVFSPQIVRIIAPGFIIDNYKFNLTILLTRIMFPYFIFIALTAYAMGILHTFKRFGLPALGPALLNISMIVFILISYFFNEPVIALALGVLVGGILQLVIQIPAIYRMDFRFRLFEIQIRHPVVNKITYLLIPRIFGSAIYQLNVFMDTVFASLTHIVGEGAVAAIYYANRLVQFPLAVFGIALSTASLPVMSEQVAINDIERMKSTVSFSLRNIFFVMFPSSIGLFLLSHPIIKVLFERGNFNYYSTCITSWTLIFYSLGLVSFSAIKVLSSAFFSLQDTRTPVKTTALCLIINLILNSILMWPLKVGGLALASSISSTINFLLLFYLLEKRIGRFNYNLLINSFLKISVGTLIMGLVIYLSWRNLFLNLAEHLRLAMIIILAFGIFIFICSLLKVEELNTVRTVWSLKRR
ncbi:MAG: murein biosynthesis integral membrane protein MurJ [Candidatus Omnitrophica bacterium]|nr:murein biosynthesis integral membrane protein MurJ [Candidatus Omnitrophota bacterium]